MGPWVTVWQPLRPHYSKQQCRRTRHAQCQPASAAKAGLTQAGAPRMNGLALREEAQCRAARPLSTLPPAQRTAHGWPGTA